MKALLAGSYAAVLLLAAAAPAVASQAAPPQYESSEPSDGATVHQPPERVEATFDQPLDDSSSLVVTDACDRTVDDGRTEVDGNTMSVALEKAPSGEYHVEWTAVGLGGVTGTSKGHFTFTAHGGKACDGEKTDHHPDHPDDPDDPDHPDHPDDGKGNHDDHGDDHGGSSDHDDNGTHTTHSSMSSGTSHNGHDGTGGREHNNHTSHAGDEKSQGNGGGESGEIPGITSADDRSRNVLSRADTSALLLSLGLCLVLGVLGGAILRASGIR